MYLVFDSRETVFVPLSLFKREEERERRRCGLGLELSRESNMHGSKRRCKSQNGQGMNGVTHGV